MAGQKAVDAPAHYDQNGYSTACGQRVGWPEPGSALKPRSVVDHGAATNVESRVGCAACRDWLRSYREAFPRGETLPDIVAEAEQAQARREAAEVRRAEDRIDADARREAWEAEVYSESRRTPLRAPGRLRVA